MSTTEVEGKPEDPEENPRLALDVTIDKPSACERHVTVKVAHEDVARYLKEAFNELMPKAELPGFRPGRAPRKLVESRFKEHVADQVKGVPASASSSIMRRISSVDNSSRTHSGRLRQSV